LASAATSASSSPCASSAISNSGPRGRGVKRASQAPQRMRAESLCCSQNSRSRVVFPTPASPPSSTSRPLPPAKRSSRTESWPDRSSSWLRCSGAERGMAPHTPPVARPAQYLPVVLRNGVEVEDPLTVVLDFVAAYGHLEAGEGSGATSFRELDLRLAN